MKEISIYIGIAAGILTSISLIPQLVKIIRKKKSDDVSFIMLVILQAGVGMWVWYGITKNDYPIIITNSFSFLVNVLTIIFGLVYKRKT